MAAHYGNLLAVFVISSATLCFTATLLAEMDQEHLSKLAKANNDLALNLHRRLTAGSSDNVIFSPVSLSVALAMALYGTKGQTAKELRSVLGYDAAELPEELVHQTFQKLLTESLPSKDPSAYVLKTANSILLDKHLDLVPTYKEEVQDLYQASVQDVDFAKEGPQVVQNVNAWVKDKTNGKIEKLVDELDSATVMVLLNAVYFKGTWKTQFESTKTRPQTFYNNGLETGAKKVPMMRMTELFPYAVFGNTQIVELPYKGENISMMILLPNDQNGLETLEKDLTLENLEVIRNQLHKKKVHLKLPKFRIEYSREMSGHFQDLGAKDVFQPGADFSGLATDKDIFVNQVLHKAVVEVNEEGSEAAAVTGIISNRMRPIFEYTPNFVADHPFLFVIVDKRSGMILFLGRVTKL